jgi:hypothetical protein
MGIYISEWLEYALIIDLNPDTMEKILEILKKFSSIPCIKSQGEVKYITIDEYDDERLLKTMYYNDNQAVWNTYFSSKLVKIDKKYCEELVIDSKKQSILDSIMSSELKDYVIDFGWYKNSSIGTTYCDEPLGRHYLEYIMIVNIENNSESIKTFKERLCKVCNENKVTVPNLFRHIDTIFIKITQLTESELYSTDHYKHYYPLWNLNKNLVERIPVINSSKLKLSTVNENLVDILIKSEISSNIVKYGWYDVFD